MVVTLTEQRATPEALPAIFNMEQFMTLQLVNRGERSITHVARKEGLIPVHSMVLTEICLSYEAFSTIFTDKGPLFFVQPFVFYQLWYISEGLTAQFTPITTF